MNSISSQLYGLYSMYQQHIRNIGNPQRAENSTPEQAKNADVTETVTNLPVHLTNVNILSDDTQTTVFALTQSDQQTESAGRLTPDIAPLSDVMMSIESLLTAQYESFDYLEIMSNPQKAMQEHQESYDEFLQGGQNVIDQMRAMDDTGLLEFRFTINGPQVEMNNEYEKLTNLPTTESISEKLQAAQKKRDEIMGWISDHRAEHKEITEKGVPYAYAKAAVDYEEKYGITRDTAIHSGMDAIESYALTVHRSALNHYGVNAMNEAETTARYGASGKFTYAMGRPVI